MNSLLNYIAQQTHARKNFLPITLIVKHVERVLQPFQRLSHYIVLVFTAHFHNIYSIPDMHALWDEISVQLSFVVRWKQLKMKNDFPQQVA